MEISDERIAHAVRNTEILRAPRQTLATFGTTNIYYYLLTEPAYSELIGNYHETVIREGRVVAERPKIVTPYYLSRLEGFSKDARRYFEMLVETQGAHAPGIIYTYRNESREFNIVSDNLLAVADKLKTDIERRGDPLASIIKGEDELWDVSLMKFIYEMTSSSLHNNLSEMGSLGLLKMDSRGVPADARVRIEELFSRAARGDADPSELKKELDQWNLFAEYEDRFLNLFRKGK
jgi:hypothetical protein